MSYMQAVSACFGCGRTFCYNPELVPSVRVKGVREPFCLDCVERANPIRREKGLSEIVPAPGAYEAQEVAW